MLVNRLYAYGIVTLAVLLCIWSWGHARYKAGEAAAEARMAADVAKANQDSRDQETAANARVARLNEVHQNEITQLDARYRDVLARIPPVRVCPKPRGGELPKAPADAGVHSDSPGRSAGTGEDGKDIAPALMAYALEKEKYRLALKACQDYGREIERFSTQFPAGD